MLAVTYGLMDKMDITARIGWADIKDREYPYADKHGRQPRYGYQRDGQGVRENKAEQRVIDIILQLRRDGASFKLITSYLNGSGISPREGSAKWHATAVVRIHKAEE